MSLKVTVIGCGRWGSFIANYLASNGHDVTLYGPKGAPDIEKFIETRASDLITLCDELKLSTSLADSITSRDVIIISIPSQRLRGLLGEMRDAGFRSGRITLCMKGLEIETGKRLTEIVSDEMGDAVETAVWIGPGHVQEFTRGIPNCMVIDSKSEDMKKLLVEEFSSDVIRFYYGTDLIGNELGAAAKNVIGIAAGMLDGMGLSSLKGALMSRGTREVARLIKALGGNELSAYGLCHLGDYEATVFSKFSHNRYFGEAFIKGEKFDKLAEGYYTVRALTTLAERYGVDMPISFAVEDVLYR
jgi:glycerol-3-phosphate dehydrogenase (NAD(P)+)